MADKPILFSGPMVRALLAGAKTQTRRLSASVAAVHAQRYKKGDRLYVREHWRTSGSLDMIAPRDLPCDAAVVYEADDFPKPNWRGRFRQGMHMPRWASRLTLTVTDVQVERLQDISEEDALAEGVKPWPLGEWLNMPGFASVPAANVPAKTLYCYLWEHINGPGSWSGNPWVAAYTFTVERGNIDQLARAA